MAKQPVGPRISEAAAKYYSELFDTLNQGAAYALESFPQLYRATLARELRGKFTAGELSAILENVNGLMLSPEAAGQHLPFNIEDGIALEALDEKWGFDGAGLLEKLRALSLFQSATLELWARAFWVQHTDSDSPESFESYVARMASK